MSNEERLEKLKLLKDRAKFIYCSNAGYKSIENACQDAIRELANNDERELVKIFFSDEDLPSIFAIFDVTLNDMNLEYCINHLSILVKEEMDLERRKVKNENE